MVILYLRNLHRVGGLNTFRPRILLAFAHSQCQRHRPWAEANNSQGLKALSPTLQDECSHNDTAPCSTCLESFRPFDPIFAWGFAFEDTKARSLLYLVAMTIFHKDEPQKSEMSHRSRRQPQKALCGHTMSKLNSWSGASETGQPCKNC